jgi:hypothetical protein
MKRKTALIPIILLIIQILTACEPIGAPEKTAKPVEITTAETEAPVVEIYGETFESVPGSVVCLSPALVEIIYEIGAEGFLVGVGQYCDYPESVMIDKTVCGSAANPDFTAIKGLSPELMLTQSPIATKDLTALNAAGIEVLYIPAVKNMAELQTLYDSLTELFETPIAGLPNLITEPDAGSIGIGNFVYYLSDDYMAAGDDTFAGNFFSGYGSNLCKGISEEIPPAADESDSSDETETANPLKEVDTIILPAYLEYLAESFAETSPEAAEGEETPPAPQIIVLSEESSKLLERPTSRVELVISEVAEKKNQISQPEAEEPPTE